MLEVLFTSLINEETSKMLKLDLRKIQTNVCMHTHTHTHICTYVHIHMYIRMNLQKDIK